MYTINKITSDHVVDFAAEELKKYLRMMMPRCGEIKIVYAPEASDGFRLGVMSDFGLDTSEAEDVSLDDILHIDTDLFGGVIAGSNPRSVLLAVYRYLTINGCRWLFPGIDGEFIPIRDIAPTSYHKMADCRYRGQCNEGAEAQHLMMEAIDFTPKIGLNIFMLEFDVPSVYYNRYYNSHLYNEENREAEPVTLDTILQWKRQCEAEISKRGLQFHDMGHGWTVDPFGISSAGGFSAKGKVKIPEESRPYVAMINGERELFMDIASATNFCMSNPDARGIVRDSIVRYAEKATNVDYLHVWLADSHNNHCECEECQKMLPSDWYVTLMNEVDEELTRRNIDTRIVMICYVDSTWAPEKCVLKNPERFSLLVAAISRDYSIPVTPGLDTSRVSLAKYVRNNLTLPATVDEYITHAKKWKEACKLPSMVYEYHYWWPQYRDLGLFEAVKLIYNDVLGYRSNGCNGIIEDGSQRSYFPNGYSFHVYASTLYDTSSDLEAMKEDYFRHAYGEDYGEVIAFFERLEGVLPYHYFVQKFPSKGDFYHPELVKDFEKVAEIVDEFAPFVQAHKVMPYRAQAVSYKILDRYLEYCKGISVALAKKANGEEEAALEAYHALRISFGRHELELERWYDQQMCFASLGRIFTEFVDPKKKAEFAIMQ